MTDITARPPFTIDEYHADIEQHWTRNPISRRAALRGALLGAGAIALVNFPALKKAFAANGGVSGPSGAVLVGRHISFASDHRLSPTNAIRITTQAVFPNGVNASGVTAKIRYGHGPGYGHRIDADIVNLTGVVPGAPNGDLAGNQFYVKATIDRLEPGTTYHYRVELSDGTMTGDASFTTAPDRSGLGYGDDGWGSNGQERDGHDGHGRIPAPFTFTSFGDHGTNKPVVDPAFAYANKAYSWATKSFDDNYYNSLDPVLAYDTTPAETMTALVAAQNPVFHLVNGDVSYADPSGSGLPVEDSKASGTHGGALPGKNAYNPYTWDVYLAQIEASSSSIPWMIATGNHDMEALYGNHGYGGHQARFDLPQNGPSGCHPSTPSCTPTWA